MKLKSWLRGVNIVAAESWLGGVKPSLSHDSAVSMILLRQGTRIHAKFYFHWLTSVTDSAMLSFRSVREVMNQQCVRPTERWIFLQIHLRLRKYFGVRITGPGEMFDEKKIEISKISWDPPFNRTLRITVKIFGWYIMPYLRNCQIRSLIVTSSLECRKGSANTWQKERKREKTRLRPLHSQCEN